MYNSENNFSDNTIVEDYAMNLLKSTRGLPNRVLFATGDTELFATRYVQLVFGSDPDLVVSNYSAISVDWFDKKMKRLHPDWIFPIKTEKIDFEKEVLAPNFPRFSVLATANIYGPKALKSTFYPLGIHLQPGKGYFTQKSDFVPEFRSDISIIDSSPYLYNSFRLLYSKYAYYFIVEGQNKHDAGDIEGALSSFEKALGIFPYCVPALENICKIVKSQNKTEPKCAHLEEMRNYFNYYQARIE